MKFLKENPGPILTIIFGILALFAWIFPFSAEKRGLDVSLSQNVELRTDHSIYKIENLDFSFNGKKIQNLVSTKVRFQNTGTQPIKKEDFVSAISIIFPSNVEIINYTVQQTQPIKNYEGNLQTYLSKGKDYVLLFKPDLINPGDVYDVNILTTQKTIAKDEHLYGISSISLDYKIFGVGKINNVFKIETNIEKQFLARKVLTAEIIPVGVFILLLSFLLKTFPFYERKVFIAQDGETQRRLYYTGIIIILLVVSLILYILIKNAYHAFFIEI